MPLRPHVAVLLNLTPDHLDRHAARLEQLRHEDPAGRYQVDVVALSRKIADEILAETAPQPSG